MNLDEAKLAILKFLDIEAKLATNVKVEYDANSDITTTVTYETGQIVEDYFETKTKTFITKEKEDEIGG